MVLGDLNVRVMRVVRQMSNDCPTDRLPSATYLVCLAREQGQVDWLLAVITINAVPSALIAQI